MTPPVLLEGAPGGVPVVPGAAPPAVQDPALAAEFAAILGAAMPEAIAAATPVATFGSAPVVWHETVSAETAPLYTEPEHTTNAAETSVSADPEIEAKFANVIVRSEGETVVVQSAAPIRIPESAPKILLELDPSQAPPGPAPNTAHIVVPEVASAIVEREGETEAARSAAPNEILDSAPITDERFDNPTLGIGTADAQPSNLPPLNSSGLVTGLLLKEPTRPHGPRVLNDSGPVECVTGPKSPGVKIPHDGGPIVPMDPRSSFPLETLGRPELTSEGVSSEASIPDGALAVVTSVSGGGAEFHGEDRESGDEPGQEIMLGEATNLVTDRSEGFEVVRTDRLESRSLDRGERTRIVHEVIDRVTKHVETLAIARSRDPLTIQLEPADLGRIVVEVSREATGLVAEMSASDPRVAETLDRHRSELAAGLAARGYAEARVTVNAAPASENQGFDLRREGGQTPQHQHQHQHQPHAHRANHAPSVQPSFHRPSDRLRTRVRATGLDLEI